MTTTLPFTDTWRVRPSEPFRNRLTQAQWDKASELGVRRTYVPGDVITSQETTGASVAIVDRGWVKSATITPRGTTAMNLLYGPGDLFGTEALAGYPRAESTTPLLLANLLLLNVSDFLGILSGTPKLLWALHRYELQRRVIADHRRAAMASSSGSERLALTLISLRCAFAPATMNYGPITIPLRQDELSELAGTHRNTTVEALKTFRRIGALHTGRRQLTILDTHKLARYTTKTAEAPPL